MPNVKKLNAHFEPHQDDDTLTIDCTLNASVDGVFENYTTTIEIATDATSRKFIDLYDLCDWNFKNWSRQKLEELRNG